MVNIIMIRSWSRDPGLIINEINNTEKGKKWINIIPNKVLPGRWGIAVFCTGSSSDSRDTETRYTKDKNK